MHTRRPDVSAPSSRPFLSLLCGRYALAQKSLAAFPDHHDTHELLKQLGTHFTML